MSEKCQDCGSNVMYCRCEPGMLRKIEALKTENAELRTRAETAELSNIGHGYCLNVLQKAAGVPQDEDYSKVCGVIEQLRADRDRLTAELAKAKERLAESEHDLESANAAIVRYQAEVDTIKGKVREAMDATIEGGRVHSILCPLVTEPKQADESKMKGCGVLDCECFSYCHHSEDGHDKVDGCAGSGCEVECPKCVPVEAKESK